MTNINPISVEIRRENLHSPSASALILALNAELSARYPEEGATHFRLDPEEVEDGRGAFLVAYADHKPLGCGALRRLDSGTGEIKRMYVVPESRGRGIARAILTALETEARRLGFTRLLLETGVRQMEAQSLYQKFGFVQIPAYGEYVGCPLSICLSKRLSSNSQVP